MFRVGFTGTQHGMTEAQKREVRRLLQELAGSGETALHHGDCIGADADAHEIAVSLGMQTVGHPPSGPWKRAWCTVSTLLPERPYLDRNKDIVRLSSVLIATPAQEQGGEIRSGTWSTVRFAQQGATRRKIYIVRPSGRVEVRGG